MWQEQPGSLVPGAVVHARGERWRILDVRPYSACVGIGLRGIEASNAGTFKTLLVPFDRLHPLERDGRVRLVRRRAWMRRFRTLLATCTRYGTLRALATARIELFPYQLEPALACLRGVTRLLLADAVGLGKTIQAGLILAELHARDRSTRALIVTPAGLREQWAEELADKFSLAPTILDADWLRRQTSVLPSTVNPWTVPAIVITSIDFIKRPEVLHAAEGLIWDLLIIDEAHAVGGASDRTIAARAIGTRARKVVLITATPHAGDTDAFRGLCDIGRLDQQDPLVSFRRSRAAVGWPVRRRARLLPVRLSPAEQRMHALLQRYGERVWRESATRNAARLAMIVLRKRAFSSAASLARSIARRLSALGGALPPPEVQLVLPLDDQAADAPDAEPTNVLAAPGLLDQASECAWLAEIAEAAAAAAAAESKLRAVQRLLARVREPVIIFTEYRDTLLRIAAAIEPTAPVDHLHGGLSRAERHAALVRFATGATRILLATDAGGEGLNLHATCRLVINLELPWSPRRLEQRIGRVDRIGQTKRVHALHFFAADTAEAAVLAHLARRLERARVELGPLDDPLGLPSEEAIADAIVSAAPLDPGQRAVPPRAIGSTGQPLSLDPLTEAVVPHLLPLDLRREAEDEAERVRSHRVLVRAGRYGKTDRAVEVDDARTWVSVIRRRRLEPRTSPGAGLHGIICLFRGQIRDGQCRLLEEHLVPCLIDVSTRPTSLSCAAVREHVEQTLSLSLEQVASLAARSMATRHLAVTAEHAPVAFAANTRDEAIARHQNVFDQALDALVQPGLFDRRALRAIDCLRRDRDARRQEVNDRSGRFDQATEVTDAKPELALVLAVYE